MHDNVLNVCIYVPTRFILVNKYSVTYLGRGSRGGDRPGRHLFRGGIRFIYYSSSEQLCKLANFCFCSIVFKDYNTRCHQLL